MQNIKTKAVLMALVTNLVSNPRWFLCSQTVFIQAKLLKSVDEETDLLAGGFPCPQHPLHRHQQAQQVVVLLKHHHGCVVKYLRHRCI